MADFTGPQTRTRQIILRGDPYRNIIPGYNKTGVVRIAGTQMTVSEGHPFKKRSRFKGEDVGGDFYTISRRYRDDRGDEGNPVPQVHYHGVGSTPDRIYDYYGPLYPVSPAVPTSGKTPFSKYWPPDLSYSDAQLYALGATAIARCDPVKSPANLSVAMAELIREGIPKALGHTVWAARNLEFKSLGDEYLNVQFGWLPFVADIKDTASAILNMDDLMKQYERDSGRLVRRGYTFPTIRETTITDPVTDPNAQGFFLGDGKRPSIGYVALPGAKTVLEREIVRKIWFSGAFTYYLPSDYESRSAWQKKLYLARQLLGLEVTPEVLWNLTPWSWAADWFGNIGDNMHNLSSFASDGLLLRYGYLMEHTTIRDTYTAFNYRCDGWPGGRPLSMTLITEIKKRRRATPFGFGIDKGSLTSRQLSIAAALGISRL